MYSSEQDKTEKAISQDTNNNIYLSDDKHIYNIRENGKLTHYEDRSRKDLNFIGMSDAGLVFWRMHHKSEDRSKKSAF